MIPVTKLINIYKLYLCMIQDLKMFLLYQLQATRIIDDVEQILLITYLIRLSNCYQLMKYSIEFDSNDTINQFFCNNDLKMFRTCRIFL